MSAQATRRRVRKFNPGTFQSDAEVKARFAVRGREFGHAMEALRGNIGAESCQHILVAGPRGFGKTMLLARIEGELRNDPELSAALLPVRFAEESQEVFGIADFWLEALFHLARACAARDPALAAELRETHADLAAHWTDRSVAERARAAVLEAARLLDRQLVLMVENLQDLDEDAGADFGWQLRETLQTRPEIVLLATATSEFGSLRDARKPFFELFRAFRLARLATADCACLWESVTGRATTEREIRPLEILTGGNPRLLVIVAEFAGHGSLRRLLDELVALVDEHTEYFRGHLDALAKTERRVYLAAIDLWRPSTAAEIAARARMDIRTVSSLLKRLMDRGAIVADGAGRRRRYAAAERLYCIYYKLRRERDEAAVVHSLIRFMAGFYSEAELTDMARGWRDEIADAPAIVEGIRRAMKETPHLAHILAPALPSNDEVWEEWDSLSEAEELAASEDFTGAIRLCDLVIGRFRDSAVRFERFLAASAFSVKGQALSRRDGQGDQRAAINAFDAALVRFGEIDQPENGAIVIRNWIAATFLEKGTALAELDDSAAAIPAYEQALAHFGESDDPDVQQMIAEALCRKGLALERLGEPAWAISIFDEAVARFGDSDSPSVTAWVASAFAKKGWILANGGKALREFEDLAPAIEAYDEAIARFGDSDEASIRVWVVLASFDKARLYAEFGNPTAAMEAFLYAYVRLPVDDRIIGLLTRGLIPLLVAFGISERELLEVLSSDPGKAAALEPLIVALRLRLGEEPRAPEIVLEVARDVNEHIDKVVAEIRAGAA